MVNLNAFQRHGRAALLGTVFLAALLPSAVAGWQLGGTADVEPNTSVLVHLTNPSAANQPGTSSTLWLSGSRAPDVLSQATIVATNGNAYVPLFVRGEGDAWLSVFDQSDGSSSTIRLHSRRKMQTNQQQAWLPQLKVSGEGGVPVMIAGQSTTAVLELQQGSGPLPPTTHISAVDHRGRLVLSLFYNTFDLTAAHEQITIPAAGEYTLTVKLLAEERDAFPRARFRSPIPLGFGNTVSKHEIPVAPPGVTTQTVLGSRVALEHMPTTATVVGVDQLRMAVFGRPSNEIQRNRWPYVIAGVDLTTMTREQRYQEGADLLRWQRRLGSSFAPISIEWADIQRGPGSYNWAALNDAFHIHRQLMVRPLVTLHGRAAWNQELPTDTTSTLSAWKGFAEKIIDKFGDKTWGIYCWEHPAQTWPDPAKYREALLATADGIQFSKEEQRKAPSLVVGPLTGFNESYLNDLLTSDVASRVNAIALDMYPSDPTSSPESNRLDEQLQKAVDFLKKRDLEQLGVWITGTAWPAGPGGVSPKLQANYLVRAHVIALTHGVQRITWDGLQNGMALRAPSGWTRGGKTGLLDENQVPTPAGVAYGLMTYLASGVTTPTVTRQGDARITSFNLPLQSNKWPGTLYVAWTDSPDKVQTVQLDMKHGGGVYALDYLGAEIPTIKVAGDAADSITGTYKLPVGYEPVYIWDAGLPQKK